MDLELYPKNNAPNIEGYGEGYIKVSGDKFYNTILLLTDQYFEIEGLLNKNNKTIIKNKINHSQPEMIIYGTLKGLGYESDMLNFLKSLNIPLEVMQIGSACRTWSVLIGDGRSISAIIEPG